MTQKFKVGDAVELAQANPLPHDKDNEWIAFQGKVVGTITSGKNFSYEVKVDRPGGAYVRVVQEQDLRKVGR